MATMTEIGNGVRTVYSLPIHNKTATATVNGGAATLASQQDASVTFSVAPANGSTVVITYTPVAQSSSSSGSTSGATVVGQSGTNVTVTGTTTKTEIARVTIPAGTVKANGCIRVIAGYSCTGSGGTKLPSIELGAVNMLGTGFVMNTVSTAAQLILVIRNQNSTNSQWSVPGSSAGGLGTFTSTAVTAAADMTAAQDLVFYITLSSAADSATLRGYTVEVVNP